MEESPFSSQKEDIVKSINPNEETENQSNEFEPTTILLLDRGGLPVLLQSNIEINGEPLQLSNELTPLVGGFLNAIFNILDRLKPLGGNQSNFSISTASNEDLMAIVISPSIKSALAKIVLTQSARVLANVTAPGQDLPQDERNALRIIYNQYLKGNKQFQYSLPAFWKNILEKIPEIRFIVVFNALGEYLYSSIELNTDSPHSSLILSVVKETLSLFVKSHYGHFDDLNFDDIPEIRLKNYPQSNIWHFNIEDIVYVFYETWDTNLPAPGLLRIRLNQIIQENYRSFQEITQAFITKAIYLDPHEKAAINKPVKEISLKIEYDENPGSLP